ncbi:hypothetical protein FISHEDRAFT_70808, partial [Fistulina hepatica ATCC 64428]
AASSPVLRESRSRDAEVPHDALDGLEQARAKSLAPVDVRELFTASLPRAATPATVSPPARSKVHGSSSGELRPVSRIDVKPSAPSRAFATSPMRPLVKTSTSSHSVEQPPSPSSRAEFQPVRSR